MHKAPSNGAFFYTIGSKILLMVYFYTIGHKILGCIVDGTTICLGD